MLYEDEIDDKLLDRLVDGELADAEYRQVIEQLEESPDAWRRCALSFLEQQALQRDLRQLLKDRNQLDLHEVAAPRFERHLDAADSSNEFPQPKPNGFDRWFARPIIRWSTVLAVGILAFVGGIALRPLQPPGNDAESGLSRDGNEIPQFAFAPNAARSTQRANRSADSVIIDDGFGGDTSSLEVPIRLISDPGEDGQPPKFAPEYSAREIASFLGNAYNPNRVERLVYIIRTRDGRLYLLPIDRITPGVVFQ